MTEQNKGKKAQRTFSDGVAHILAGPRKPIRR